MRPALLLLVPALSLAAQSPLARVYREGEVLVYRMKASHDAAGKVNTYEATATMTVQKGKDGVFEESIAWSGLVRDGKATELPAASRAFRQILSRSPGRIPAMPDLKGTQFLDGPALDLLTFYADLFVAGMFLQKPGDHRTLPCPQANRFAFGPDVVIAEQAIDFDLTMQAVDPAKGTATILVRHIPPKTARVQLPASWMRPEGALEPFNWVQVLKRSDGTFSAEVGRETFTVELLTDLKDGKLLRATMDNPVDILAHTCARADLTPTDVGRRYRIHRKIELELLPQRR